MTGLFVWISLTALSRTYFITKEKTISVSPHYIALISRTSVVIKYFVCKYVLSLLYILKAKNVPYYYPIPIQNQDKVCVNVRDPVKSCILYFFYIQ